MQACVRRWLARARYKRAKWQMAHSVMTLQRYVRGWLTRRHYQEQRRLAEQKRQEQEAKAKKGLQINMDNYVTNVHTSHVSPYNSVYKNCVLKLIIIVIMEVMMLIVSATYFSL